MNGTSKKARIDWVDYAKGICILLVVAFHTISGVERVSGQEIWTDHLVIFATPFRMPDFFLISGLFLARVIDRDWRGYADKKVLHFAYFYLLWLVIVFAVRGPGMAADYGALETVRQFFLSLIDPFGSMWFIYILPIFFVFAKLMRDAGVPAAAVLGLGVVLEALPVHTGWTVIDEFAARFVYFYAGYLFAGQIFAIAGWVQNNVAKSLAGLVVWALVNGAIVYAGFSKLPGVSLALGLAGGAAVVSIAALLARAEIGRFLRYMGANSIVIYLAFFLPMGAARAVLLKLGLVPDLGTVSILVVATAIVVPLALHHVTRNTTLKYLFVRPGWAKLKPETKITATVAAE